MVTSKIVIDADRNSLGKLKDKLTRLSKRAKEPEASMLTQALSHINTALTQLRGDDKSGLADSFVGAAHALDRAPALALQGDAQLLYDLSSHYSSSRFTQNTVIVWLTFALIVGFIVAKILGLI